MPVPVLPLEGPDQRMGLGALAQGCDATDEQHPGFGCALICLQTFSAHGLRITKKHEVSYSAKGGLTTECGLQMKFLGFGILTSGGSREWEASSLPLRPWQPVSRACFCSLRRD